MDLGDNILPTNLLTCNFIWKGLWHDNLRSRCFIFEDLKICMPYRLT